MSQTILITGANRGIGLEMCRQWQQRGDTVIAVCRTASSELQALAVEIIEGIDVSREADVQQLAERLAGRHLDLLFNNAGIMRDESLQAMDYGQILEQFQVNTLGPLRVTLALLDNLAAGGKIGLMTSRMGSMADNSSGGRYGYRISKAGLNAAGKSLAVDLAPREIAVAILHPGWVQTGMTGGTGHLTPAQAASQLLQRMDALSMATSGTFWHSDGSVLPW